MRTVATKTAILPPALASKYIGHIKNKGGKIVFVREPKTEGGTGVVKAGSRAEQWASFYDDLDAKRRKA